MATVKNDYWFFLLFWIELISHGRKFWWVIKLIIGTVVFKWYILREHSLISNNQYLTTCDHYNESEIKRVSKYKLAFHWVGFLASAEEPITVVCVERCHRRRSRHRRRRRRWRWRRRLHRQTTLEPSSKAPHPTWSCAQALDRDVTEAGRYLMRVEASWGIIRLQSIKRSTWSSW